MSELEHCRLAHEGKLDALIEKIQSNHVENLPRKKDQSGRTALHWVCKSLKASAGGKEDIVRYLFETFNVPLDESDDSGWTPLMISASAGSFDLVKFFLEHGSNPNSANENKQRPLHYAASKNFPKIASLLLEKGAEPNAADNYGNTALHRACSKGHMKIAEILLDQYKASVNQPDTEGNTPLHLACEEQRIEMAKFLLKHGANPHAKNKEEKTPIDITEGGLLNIL